MSKIFDPQEILRISIRIEEKGKALYGELERQAKQESLKKIWRYLKEQEELHRKVFQGMLDHVGDYIVFEFSSGEYDAYMKAIASGYVFTESLIDKKIKDGFSSDRAAVDFAITIEKDSILAYTGLKKYLLPSKQEVIDGVIEEEKRHLVQLVLLKDGMKESAGKPQ